ncbi:MAG TPA: NAD(P)/FAD-dependent oxidoreductase, partial [Chitinophagaceae bacterium]|nr:NAD(P)/FAD-dependent oxidoreductase [Chitinophagaceae bacterium]
MLPSEAADEAIIKKIIANSSGKKETEIKGFHIQKRSIDARGETVWVNLSVNAFINEPFFKRKIQQFHFRDVSKAIKRVIIIGAGPAGLFAALKLTEQGIKPVILERGKDVRARRRDLAILNKEGIINPDSNYCFGEGGAGTYSDGKLYTRSNKRGDIDRILHLFVYFGAEENILYDAHPHIGTNKLPQIITAMRKKIEECGGEFLFDQKVIDLVISGEKITAVKTRDSTHEGDAYILATGHSARDIFTLLHNKNILIHAKPFAMGVRIEHPQNLIDNIQYGPLQIPKLRDLRTSFLPPASYGLVDQVNNKGVFSFCMCPGGIIAPASTDNGELVVNGWSPSKRNNPFANSGIVVQVETEDAIQSINNRQQAIDKNSPLLLMEFQKMVEQKAFTEGGGKFAAPAQRMVDFVENKVSSSLPVCSYLPGIISSEIKNILPGFITERLKTGFKTFGKKMKGYLTNEAIIVATESRTSSPVRITRDNEKFNHPQIKNLYPCGEGAGYAGGI